MSRHILTATVLTCMTILTPMMALADDHKEIEHLANAKITLAQAIEIAEKASGGKAFDASIEDDAKQPEFEVEVVKDNKIHKVLVNGVDGKVISVQEDKDD